MRAIWFTGSGAHSAVPSGPPGLQSGGIKPRVYRFTLGNPGLRLSFLRPLRAIDWKWQTQGRRSDQAQQTEDEDEAPTSRETRKLPDPP